MAKFYFEISVESKGEVSSDLIKRALANSDQFLAELPDDPNISVMLTRIDRWKREEETD